MAKTMGRRIISSDAARCVVLGDRSQHNADCPLRNDAMVTFGITCSALRRRRGIAHAPSSNHWLCFPVEECAMLKQPV